MNKILVTGGAGFIGSHLCKKLLQNKKNKVICIDNLYTGSLNNINDLISNKRFLFFKMDISSNDFLTNIIDYCEGLTHIYNCACPASPVHYQGPYAIKTTMTCVIGTKNLLDLATVKKAKFMQFSTSEVYGEPDCIEQKEEYRGSVNCTGPRACYDEGKRCAESLCFDYNRCFKTKIKVIRIFNTYGPNMNKDDGRVVSNFICQALQNKNITIYGDGNQTRSFCYIDDLINGIITVMNTNDEFIGPVNLGNPTECSMLSIAKLILHLIPDSKSKIVYKPLPVDDPTHRRPNISRAKSLGWTPEVFLVDGIEKTIEYFKEVLK